MPARRSIAVAPMPLRPPPTIATRTSRGALVSAFLNKSQDHNAALRLARRVASRVVNPGGAPSADAAARRRRRADVLVTGASHGIGRATAIRLARAGATVLLVARSADVLEELAEQLRADGGDAHALPADLSDAEQAVPALAQRILAEHGPPDVVVNNAGKSIRRADRAVLRPLPRLHAHDRPQLPRPGAAAARAAAGDAGAAAGHIVNVSTVGVLLPPAPRWSAYQASKAAFDVWLRSVAAEVHARRGHRHLALHGARPHAHERADRRLQARARPLARTRPPGSCATRSSTGRPRSRPGGSTTAALIDVAARGTSDRLVRLYAQRFTGRAPPARVGRRPPRRRRHARGAPAVSGAARRDEARALAGLALPALRAFAGAGVLKPLPPRRALQALRAARALGMGAAGGCAVSAARDPHGLAVIDERGTLTFAELNARAERIAAALRAEHGVGPGPRPGGHVPQPPRLRRGDADRLAPRRRPAAAQHRLPRPAARAGARARTRRPRSCTTRSSAPALDAALAGTDRPRGSSPGTTATSRRRRPDARPPRRVRRSAGRRPRRRPAAS